MKRIAKFLFVLSFVVFVAGCIRVSANAGYWHQGAEDEAPKGKQVGFDTQDLIPGKEAPGSIEV